MGANLQSKTTLRINDYGEKCGQKKEPFLILTSFFDNFIWSYLSN